MAEAKTAAVLEVGASAELADPAASAEAAGLRYVDDNMPGITRRRSGKGMSYRRPDGALVHDERTLRRIKSLAIPPAWSEVWICPHPKGHIQATGRDAKGRKQYRYHPEYRALRDAVKYDRMIAFGEALPQIRRRVQHDLSLPGVPRERVLATVIRLLEETHIRVGNDEYRKQNKSFGLTTLRDRHVDIEGSKIRFHFKGKSGVEHQVEISDRRLARIVKRCQDIPGQELFQYVEADGQRTDIGSADVNDYLREISGGDFTAKDFRTWAGTVLAARLFRDCEPCTSTRDGRQQVVRTIEQVAAQLGNTVAVCRKCYVHPAIVDAYLAGQVILADPNEHEVMPDAPDYGLSAEERTTLRFLREQATALAKDAREASKAA